MRRLTQQFRLLAPWFRPAMLLVVIVIAGVFGAFHYVKITVSHQDWQWAYPDYFPVPRIYDLEQLETAERDGTLSDITYAHFPIVFRDKSALQQRFLNLPIAGRANRAIQNEPEELTAALLTKWLRKLPNVETLSLSDMPIDDELLAEVGQLQKLRHLSLTGTGINAEQLHHLSSLPTLEVLKLSECPVAGELESLSDLPNLHTLILWSHGTNNDALAVDLLNVPQVETLLMSADYSDNPDLAITDAGIAALAAHPGLRTIHVCHTANQDHETLLPQLQTQLADVNVTTPWMPADSPRLFPAAMAFICVAMACTLYVQSQLSMQLASLIPNYVRPHLLVPGLVMTAACGAFMAALWSDYPWMSFDAVFGATCFLIASAGGMWLISLNGSVHRTGRALLGMMLLLAPGIPALFLSIYETGQWVMGDLPLLSEYLIVIAATVLARLHATLEQYPQLVANAGVSGPLNRLDGGRPAKSERLRRLIAMIHDWNQQVEWHLFERGRQRGRRDSTWGHVRWLTLGSEPLIMNAVVSVLVAGIFALYVCAITMLTADADDMPPELCRLGPAIVVCIAIGIALFARVSSWGSRLKAFEYELLRPASRRQLRKELGMAFTLEMGVLYAIGLVLYAAAAVLLEQREPDTSLALDLILLGGTAGASLIATFGSDLLSPLTWRDGLRDLLRIVLWLTSVATVVALPGDAAILISAVAVHLLLCLSGIQTMRRSWQQLEVR